MTCLRSALVAFSFSTVVVSGCASTPDPAKVCTAEWIKPRTERAVDRIADRTKSAIKPLKKAAESYAKGKKPNFLQMLSLNSSFKRLERELKSGRGVKDLRTLASTCDDPSILSGALLGFMQDQGLPDAMINFIQDLPMYEELIRIEPKQS